MGQYRLSFAGPNPEKAALLQKLLVNLYDNLLPVLQDLKAPVPSAAYNTFFKDEANKEFVTTLFANVAAGAPVYPLTDPPQPWQSFTQNGAPFILVLSYVGQWTGKNGWDGFTYCQQNPVSAFVTWPEEWPMVCLCPAFFDEKPPSIYGDTPPVSVNNQPASNCLKVNAVTNNFRNTSPRSIRQPVGWTLTQYRSWILLEELAHVYYHATKRFSTDIYNVNKARKLSAQEAIANGPSYSYYAAGELFSFSSLCSLQAPLAPT